MSREQDQAPALAALLEEGVRAGVFPGAVAIVSKPLGHRSASLVACAGQLAPGEANVELSTPYDLASLTKPFVAIAALRLAQQQLVDLQEPVSRVLPELEGTPGGESSLALLLSHRAGLAAWVPLYEATGAPIGSPELKRDFLREAATHTDPSAGPSRSLYSDLGYLIAGEVLARAAGCPLDQVVRREVSAPLGIDPQIFYAASLSAPDRENLSLRVAPTELCRLRGRVVRGEVHDENCYAFGGVAGHAGLFGSAQAVLRFGLSVLSALEGRSLWLDQALLRWALTPRGPGYVVGWDTKSREGSSAGALLSEQSFGHLGFTGTSIWCDPARRLCAVLLSNRVHPTRDNVAIRAFRPRFHDRAAELSQRASAAAD